MTLKLVTFNFSIEFEDNTLSVIRETIQESRSCKRVFSLESFSEIAYCLYESEGNVHLLRAYESGSDDVIIADARILQVDEWKHVQCGSFDNGSLLTSMGAIFFYAFGKNVVFPTWTLSILTDGRLVSSKPTITQKITII